WGGTVAAASAPGHHPARLFEPLADQKVRCTACARYCVIPPGSHGFCWVRANERGALRLRSYGRAAAGPVDPVESNPPSHFRPGSRSLSIGTVGCTWGCQYCQNAGTSEEQEVQGRELSPEDAVRLARRLDCDGIPFTYNVPTIFLEYALDVIEAAH